MSKILAFGASSSSKSINKRLATYAASLVSGGDVTVLDLNDFEMPIYSEDRQKEGIPELAHAFKKQIVEADAIIISLAEHNGTYTVAFKNILDWVSVIDQNVWMERPMVLLSTSPGGRGGARILEIAKDSYNYLGGKVSGALAVPNFFDNFSDDNGLSHEELKKSLDDLISTLEEDIAKI